MFVCQVVGAISKSSVKLVLVSVAKDSMIDYRENFLNTVWRDCELIMARTY